MIGAKLNIQNTSLLHWELPITNKKKGKPTTVLKLQHYVLKILPVSKVYVFHSKNYLECAVNAQTQISAEHLVKINYSLILQIKIPRVYMTKSGQHNYLMRKKSHP